MSAGWSKQTKGCPCLVRGSPEGRVYCVATGGGCPKIIIGWGQLRNQPKFKTIVTIMSVISGHSVYSESTLMMVFVPSPTSVYNRLYRHCALRHTIPPHTDGESGNLTHFRYIQYLTRK